MNFRTLACWAALTALIASPSHAAEKLRVVASFSILGDMAAQIGGDDVSVTTLVGPNGDVHVYQPTPSDAKSLAAADLVVVNGLGLEGWLPRLIDVARPHARIVTVTDGVALLAVAGTGQPDPHAWQSLAAAKIYISNIADALITADPAHAASYRSRNEAYLAKIDGLSRTIAAEIADIPPSRRRVITTHSAFAYFGHDYGIEFVAPVGITNDSEPSAGGIAELIRQIKRERIHALFLENIADRRLIDELGRETDVTVGPPLYSDALSNSDGPAPTYLDLVRHNAETLVAGMQQNLGKDRP